MRKSIIYFLMVMFLFSCKGRNIENGQPNFLMIFVDDLLQFKKERF